MIAFQPLYDRIVIKPDAVKEETAGGLILPDSQRDKPQQGTVVGVGNGRQVDTGLQPLAVQVGDTVIFGKFAGQEFTHDNVSYLIMKENEVFAILKPITDTIQG